MFSNKMSNRLRLFAFITGLICISTGINAQKIQVDSTFIQASSGLKYKIIKEGSGDYPAPGDRIWVHYIGQLPNDSIFSSSLGTGPLEVYMGQGQLIKGWEEGLLLLRPGGEIQLIVPPDLGYGDQQLSGIPANSTLLFDVALLQVNKEKQIEPFDIAKLKKHSAGKGMRYYVVAQGKGPTAKPGDNAYIHYTGFLNNGSIFDSSRKKGDPVRITVGSDQVIKGWDMGLQLMNAGSKYRFLIPAKLAYGKEGYHNTVPPDSPIILDVEMIKITPEIKVSRWDTTGLEMHRTKSGLKYFIIKAGEGDSIKSNDVVQVNYSGYLMNGKLFDSSVKRGEPIRIPVGVGAVIDGWDEGLQLMRKGSKFQFIVPSSLAYGEQGNPPQIPADSDLIFDIEVSDIVK